MKLLSISLVATAMTLSASGASAAYLSFSGSYQTVNVSVGDLYPNDTSVDKPRASGSVYAGSFTTTQQSEGTSGWLGHGIDRLSAFDAFCLDLDGILAGGSGGGDFKVTSNPFDPARELSGQQINNVKNLFNASYGMVDNSNRTQYAAFQLALWEVSYELGTTFSLTDGNFKSTTGTVGTSGTIGDLANTYLSRIASDPMAYRYNVKFLDAENLSNQDIVTATVVPLPAAGLLLFGALGALGLTSRRRKVAAEA